MSGNAGTDPVFRGEVDVHDKAMRARAVRGGSYETRTGELDSLAMNGGVDSNIGQRSERRPLLARGKSWIDGDGNGDGNGQDDFAGLPWYKMPSMWWVLVPFGVLAVAYGGIIAPRVNLIVNLICQDYLNEQEALMPGFIKMPVSLYGSNEQCRVAEVDRRSALFTLCGNLIAGLLSAIVSPKLGALSDRFGRTKIIALTSLGSLSGDIIVILAARMPESVSVYWILVGFALDGLCGSFTTAFAIVHAYVTDCVPPSTRNVAFGYFHACLFTGIAVGPVLAGLLTKATHTAISPFYVMLAVHLFFISFMGLVIPESLSKQRQKIAQEQHKQRKAAQPSDWINSLREINILEPLKILWPTGPNVHPAVRRNLVLLASIDTMMFGVAMGSLSVVLIYVKSQFGWETYESGVFLSIVNSSRVLCLLLVLPILNRIFRGKPDPSKPKRATGSDTFDVNLIRVAVFFDTLGYAGYAAAQTGGVMIFSGVVAAIGGMGSPTLQSALTKHVRPENTGQLLGAVGLLHSLARVVAPTIFNGIFWATAETFRQTVFVCLASTFGLAFICTWFVKPGVSLDDKPESADEESEALLRTD